MTTETDISERACQLTATSMEYNGRRDYAEIVRALRSALTASEKHLAVANKLWRLCVDDDWPWADGSTQDALNELGLLYPKDMTEEDESEQCKNCEGECETCWRAVDRIEDAAMEKAK